MNALPSSVRRFVWPGAVWAALAPLVACGSSSNVDLIRSVGGSGGASGGALNVSGLSGTTGGRSNGLAESASGGASLSGLGGAVGAGSGTSGTAGTAVAIGTGGAAVAIGMGGTTMAGGTDPIPDHGGASQGGAGDASGTSGTPDGSTTPPAPETGAGGNVGTHPDAEGGAAGASGACPLGVPSNNATCSSILDCNFTGITCSCEGRDGDRRWHCAEMPKAMCPALAPKHGGRCTTKNNEHAVCRYEEAALDCTCTDGKWDCDAVSAP